MSTTTETTRQTETTTRSWQAGLAGGAVGAAVMGALILAMNDAVIAVAIPSLYTLAPPPNPVVGFLVHVFHGAALGVAFAAIAGISNVDSTGRLVVLGLAWGVAIWIVLAALVMPIWLDAVGSPAAPPFPNFAPPSLLWHGVYGLVLGGVYAGLKDVL